MKIDKLIVSMLFVHDFVWTKHEAIMLPVSVGIGTMVDGLQ